MRTHCVRAGSTGGSHVGCGTGAERAAGRHLCQSVELQCDLQAGGASVWHVRTRSLWPPESSESGFLRKVVRRWWEQSDLLRCPWSQAAHLRGKKGHPALQKVDVASQSLSVCDRQFWFVAGSQESGFSPEEFLGLLGQFFQTSQSKAFSTGGESGRKRQPLEPG